MSTFEHDAELHDWSTCPAWDGGFVVVGLIYGDRTGRFEDGVRVRTSLVDWLENGRLTTISTKYLLVNKEEQAVNEPSGCEACDGFGCCWNNADPTSGQWAACEECGDTRGHP